MVDSATESCIESVRRLNGELLEISEKTFLSSPFLQQISSSLKEKWLCDEELVKAFHLCFKEYQVDERLNAARSSNSMTDEAQDREVTVKEKLIEKKTFIENEIEKLKDNQALIESAIPVRLKHLEHSRIPTIKRNTS